MDQSMWRSRTRSPTKSTSRSLGAVRGVVDIFNTLHVFTKEPIREQEITLECINQFQWHDESYYLAEILAFVNSKQIYGNWFDKLATCCYHWKSSTFFC